MIKKIKEIFDIVVFAVNEIIIALGLKHDRRLCLAVVLLLLVAYTSNAQESIAPTPKVIGDLVPDLVVTPYSNAKNAFTKQVADNYLAIPITVTNTTSGQASVTGATLFLDRTQCAKAAQVVIGFPVSDCQVIADQYFRFAVAAIPPTPQDELMGATEVRLQNRRSAFLLRLADFGATIGTTLLPFNFVGRDFRAWFPLVPGVVVPALKQLFPDASPAQIALLQRLSLPAKPILGPGESGTYYLFLPTALLFASDNWKMFQMGVKGSRQALEMRQVLNLILVAGVRWTPVVPQPQRFSLSRKVERPAP